MKTPWQEFIGYAGQPLSKLTNAPQVLFYREIDGHFYLGTCSPETLDQDGWHRGRNERFSHWAPVTLP